MKKLLFMLSTCLLILTACQSNTNETINDQDKESLNVDEIEIQTEVGVYKEHHGFDWIDIETDEGRQSFQLTEDARADLPYVEEEDKVKFHYFHHKGKRMIDYIEKEEYFNQPRQHHQGHHHYHMNEDRKEHHKGHHMGED